MSMEITAPGWKLMHDNGAPVCRNTVVLDFRGDPVVVMGGRPPHKPSSTGFVTVKGGREFYPPVINAKWVPA